MSKPEFPCFSSQCNQCISPDIKECYDTGWIVTINCTSSNNTNTTTIESCSPFNKYEIGYDYLTVVYFEIAVSVLFILSLFQLIRQNDKLKQSTLQRIQNILG